MIIRRTWLSTTRACLKKAFRELRVSVCGRFYPNEGGVAGYGNRMRVKYTAKWGLQIAEMIFQTRSRPVIDFILPDDERILVIFNLSYAMQGKNTKE